MRLHHLEVQAFGPFAGHVAIDLDRLSEAGLFLLSGPTGAGKTSVLDAVCFALYGDVPGDRGVAKRLRCDQAAPGVAPTVTLEATLAGRRFRIVRSPAWERPKKRGSGTTTQQASVTISERVEGAWTPLSSRLDETGHLVTRLVGMNLAQFTQVAMLPQGRFQAFLRARSEERHQLLQRLFRTGRFEDVERWLRDRRVTLRRRSEACHQAVADLVSRVSEATDAGLPGEWDIRDLTGPAADGALAAWAAGLCEEAAATRDESSRASAVAAEAEAAAHARLDAARSLLERRARLDTAAGEHQRLLEQTERVDAARRALDAARRAATVIPVHRMVTAATATRDRAAQAASEATTTAADGLGLLLVDRETLDHAAAEAADAAAGVRAALPRQARLEAVEAEVGAVDARRGELAERVAGAGAEQAALPERITTLRAELSAAEAARAELPQARARLADLDDRAAAVVEVASATTELEAARTDWLEVRETALARHEQLLALRQARIEGMAAEIAGALAVGACCPVCGSDEHPQKASPAPGAPDGEAEKAAQRALDDAKADEHVRDLKVRELTTRLATATGRAGGATPAELEVGRATLRTQIARLETDAGRAEPLEGALATAVADQDRLGRELRDLELEAATLESRATHLRAEAEELRRDLERMLAETGCADLPALLDAHLERAATARRAVQAVDALANAESALAEATAALATAVEDAGFASTAAAVEAARPAGEADELARRVADHDRRVSAVAAVLAEPGSDELARAPLPDVDALAAARADALAALGDARAVSSLWTSRHQRLSGLDERLRAALADWAPVLEDARLTNHLCAFVEGKAPDNRLQMRLSGYVLAYRLSQVVAAANERLARMSDRRYSLEHTGRRGAGETRGGLSLLVRDDWSGETRDPATLSGGETFVVSLALALGLADVITQEAGGADLDTLFVDEGFGSLDADTLDDVMDTLDSLRDGGRVVGVVSHVAEMRDRIPTQLVVTKSRQGSTVSLTC
ncbi:SMC family ATPase [Nocardioides koreensis]|uniref:Nuclease SbcCD subunit C n=1 Tax=Nocardioides koreensis TaxID=433651 RepID=A0ABP5LTX0_9ACTN